MATNPGPFSEYLQKQLEQPQQQPRLTGYEGAMGNIANIATQFLQGIKVERSGMTSVPKLVIGAGLDPYVREATSAELASWLDAQYEPFAAHSHFGLVMAEAGFQQVAEVIRARADEPDLP